MPDIFIVYPDLRRGCPFPWLAPVHRHPSVAAVGDHQGWLVCGPLPIPAARHFLCNQDIALSGKLFRTHHVMMAVIQENLFHPLFALTPYGQDQM